MRKVGIGHVYDIMESVADAGERLETVILCFRQSETLRKLRHVDRFKTRTAEVCRCSTL